MVIPIEGGKIIVNAFELVVRLDDAYKTTLQAQNDAIQLIGKGANVISVNGSECKWSVKLPQAEQLEQIAKEMSLPIL
ncbi:PTS sugar transporter subunit IIA [Vibrio sp. MACH09]|uniref:DUF3389 family protein n=1 Tax=unclassified Vibrio TaxID=2614977 RepID=UPI001493DCC2|nr:MULTISPECIES: DUF3389 family protein [unclassified Vibrio]NOI65932.1 DUF3389 family protein [Vibrio sp. 99-8-1]GLO63682.1 PTS sugar transporter subunit IIA [Vibrio sp. MACH09]